MITPDQFFTKYNGTYKEYNNDQFKFQCMDLFWLYLKEVLGINPKPYQGWGSARNCYNNFEKIAGASTNFTKIKNVWNDLNLQPKKGDIIFWGFYPGVTGLDGHVAICTGAGPTAFIAFGQNYGKPNFCRYYNHSYKGVMGWLHKK